MRKSSNPDASTLVEATETAPERGPESSLIDSTASVVYSPSINEKKLKSAFWTRLNDNPLADVDSITLTDVHQVMASKQVVPVLWARPGFKEWFLNRDENRERLEYLFNLALDAAEEIIQNPDPKAQSARVNMIKAVSELAGKFPTRAASSASDSTNLVRAIGSMDKVQLQAYLQKNGVQLQLSASGENSAAVVPVATAVKIVDSQD